MNEDHAVSIYAMAKRKVSLPGRQWKISNVLLKKVTMEGCDIQVILCHDMLCQDVRLTYMFEPLLTHQSQVRSRLIAMHQEVCKPQSMYQRPRSLATLLFFGGVAWGTLVMGREGMSPNFAKAVHVGFYFTLLLHSVLATYVSFVSRKTLKLSMSGTAAWFTTAFLSGVPVALELRELLEVDRTCKAAKEKTKAS
jgi:hypothetical protein